MRKLVRMALLGAAFGVSSAWAYVPPASFIIKTMASKHGSNKGVRIRSNLSVFTPGQNEGSALVRFKLVHHYLFETGSLRSVLSDENGRPIYHFERSLTPSSQSVDVPAQVLGTLLLDSHPQELSKFLSSESVFLGRINKAVAWVIGERAATPTTPQLWVEKDTFLPLRWIGKVQMDFQSYRVYRDLYFPRVIQVSENAHPLFKEELVELKVAPSEPRNDVKSTGFTETGSNLSQSLREAIQRYFEIQ